MLHVTTWTPDTCDCVIHYQWDDQVPQDQRIHTPLEQTRTHDGQLVPRRVCPVHSAVAAPGKHVEHHDLVKEENTRKNRVLGNILETTPEITNDVTKEEGNTVKEFLKGMEPSWSFDADRTLRITLKATASAKLSKTALKSRVEAQFAKVVIE
jgi:hypothetical protein